MPLVPGGAARAALVAPLVALAQSLTVVDAAGRDAEDADAGTRSGRGAPLKGSTNLF